MTHPQKFQNEQKIINGAFNPDFPLISRTNCNTNLFFGPKHWSYQHANPNFGDISKYKLTDFIGSGQYTGVFKGFRDNNENQVLAIRILKPNHNDKIRREVKIMQVLNGHPNIMQLHDVLIDPKYGIISMVCEYCEIEENVSLYKQMNLDDIRIYMHQLLTALNHIHSKGIMHRDIKPTNVAYTLKDKKLKVMDLGFSEFYHPLRKYSTCVGSKYYKAPELLLDFGYYDYSIDIWSVGVILLQMLSKNFKLWNYKSTEDHLFKIAELCGGDSIRNWSEKYKMPLDINESILNTEKVDIIEFFTIMGGKKKAQFTNPDVIDLLQKMCTMDHKLRISAEEALQHPFFSPLRNQPS